MAVSAKLEIEHTKMLYQQSTVCTAEIQNDGKTLLRALNAGNEGARPALNVTDVATGQVSTFRDSFPPPVRETPYDLPPGKSLKLRFALEEIVRLPGPGQFDIQAHWRWDDGAGEIMSAPVRVEVLPAQPRRAHVATSKGGPSGTYYCVWVNAADTEKEKYEAWLATMGVTGPPGVTGKMSVLQQTRLTSLEGVVEPVLSVPPNTRAPAQWVAWIQDQQFSYLLHRDGSASDPESIRLPASGFRIIPPLLLNPARPGELIPGADAMLYAPNEGGPGGRFLVLHFSPTEKPKTEQPVQVPGLSPRWMKTAYLPDGARHTFVIAPEEGRLTLRVYTWSPLHPPTTPKNLATWGGEYVAADVWLLEDGTVGGAVLLSTGDPHSPSYTMNAWRFDGRDQLDEASPVSIAWNVNDPIDYAIVRVDMLGAPHALVRKGGEHVGWYYIYPDGKLAPRGDPTYLPADIVFGAGYRPVLMLSDPGRGFRFVEPG